MTEEMQKRIETGVHNAWFSTFKGLSDIDVIKYKDVGRSSFEDGFQAGAKFILEMPEIKEAIENYTDLKALYEEEINLAQHQRGRRLFINDERIIQQQRKMLIASNSAAFNTLKSILSDRIGITEVEKIIRDSRERSLESLKKAGLCE